MKKLFSILILALISFSSAFGQKGNTFNFSAVVRNVDGVIQTDSLFDFTIEILQNGLSIYSEQHNRINTGPIGTVYLDVGGGTNPSSDFSTIDWGVGNYQVRLTINQEEMGVTDIKPVPFSLYASLAGDDGDWETDSQRVFLLNGNVGIGNSNPSEKLVVGDDLDDVTTSPNSVVIGNRNKSSFSKLTFGESSENWGSITYRNSNTQTPNLILFGIKTDGELTDGILSVHQKGRVGIGTTTPSEKLVVGTDIGEVTGAKSAIVLGDANPTRGSTIVFGEDPNYLGKFSWRNSKAKNPSRFTFSARSGPEDKTKVLMSIRDDGVTEVEALQINGGADGAESFEVLEPEKLDKGSLVVIDRDNPGKLKISSKPYDKTFVGVISGAAGVKPGVILSQKGVLEGNQLVSLWGRVFVKATTCNGAIKEGDLLTSSEVEGHVMKAKNKRKRQNAVTGKALSSLEEGEGLVLMLIQPQ